MNAIGHENTSWRQRARTAWGALSTGARLYLLGLMALPLVGLAIRLVVPDIVALTLLLVGAGFLLVGLLTEIYTLVLKAWGVQWVKWLSIPAGATVATLCYGYAMSLVNSATGQDPGYFPVAVKLLTAIAFIPLAAVAGFILSILALLVLILTFPLWQLRKSDDWLPMARIVALIVLVLFTGWIIDANSVFNRLLKGTAVWAAQSFDSFPDPSCTRDPNARVKRINGQLVIIVASTKSGTRFRRVQCLLNAQE